MAIPPAVFTKGGMNLTPPITDAYLENIVFENRILPPMNRISKMLAYIKEQLFQFVSCSL